VFRIHQEPGKKQIVRRHFMRFQDILEVIGETRMMQPRRQVIGSPGRRIMFEPFVDMRIGIRPIRGSEIDIEANIIPALRRRQMRRLDGFLEAVVH